jgi:hypothetical protein
MRWPFKRKTPQQPVIEQPVPLVEEASVEFGGVMLTPTQVRVINGLLIRALSGNPVAENNFDLYCIRLGIDLNKL